MLSIAEFCKMTIYSCLFFHFIEDINNISWFREYTILEEEKKMRKHFFFQKPFL